MNTHVLLTNDDGFEAPGLETCWNAVHRVWPETRATVVAPNRCFSAKSHATTTSPDTPLRVSLLDRSKMKGFVVDGYPADCVRVGMKGLLSDLEKGAVWVCGINPGGNLGIDVYYSGTVAAAREAVVLGCPAVALSVYKRKEVPLDWGVLESWVVEILGRLEPRLEKGDPVLWNVNIPGLPAGCAMPEIRFVPASTDPLDIEFERAEQAERVNFTYRGVYQNRPVTPGTDVEVVLSGGIAVTPLQLDTTDHSLLHNLRMG